MIRSLRARLRFGDLVAMLALFVALGGTAYAAVATDSVRSRHIADGQVKSKDLRDSGVKAKDLRAEAVRSRHVKLRCGEGQVLLDGLCFDREPVGRTANPIFAGRFCALDGGRLPTALHLLGTSSELEFDRPLWTDSIFRDDGRYRVMGIAPGGHLFPAGDPEDALDIVCVHEPLS